MMSIKTKHICYIVDVSKVRLLTQHTILTFKFSSTQIRLCTSHEKFDVWPRPNPDYIRVLGNDRELVCSRGTWLRGGGGKLFLFISCMSPDFVLVPDHQIE